MKVLFPYGVQVPIDGFRPFLGLPNLDSDVGVTGSRLVLCLQALGTDHWKTHRTNVGVARGRACAGKGHCQRLQAACWGGL